MTISNLWLSHPWLRDSLAAVATLAVALGWLRVMDALAARGLIGHRLSRKIIHIGTGPLFVLCWLLFGEQQAARWLAALVPLLITVQFILVGTGRLKDPAAVAAMTRHGDPREILRGPMFYGIVFVAATLIYWRTSPIGITALMLLCGGDGLADIVGRRFGRRRLPINGGKTWAGSLAMFLGGYFLAVTFVLLFDRAGMYAIGLPVAQISGRLALVALVATLVEALPLEDVDNLTVSLTAVLTGLLLLPI